MAGAEVVLAFRRSAEPASGWMPHWQEVRVVTDVDGRFEAGFLPACRGLVRSAAVTNDSAAFAWIASAVFDLSEAREQDVVLRAVAPAAVAFRVVDAADRPVAGAIVWGGHPDVQAGSGSPLIDQALTGADGTATLTSFLSGPWNVAVQVGIDREDRHVELRAGETTRVDFRWGATLHALDVETVGLAAERRTGLRVHASEAGGRDGGGNPRSVASDVPDEHGVAHLELLRGDRRYRLSLIGSRGEVAHVDDVDPTVGTLRWEINASDTSPTGAIRGRAVGTEGPLSGSASLMRQETGGGWSLASVESDGRFEFDDVAPGRYRLRLSAPGHRDRDEPIEVVRDRVTDLGDLRLDEPANLVVTVPDSAPVDVAEARVVIRQPRVTSRRLLADPERPGTFLGRDVAAGVATISVLRPGAVPLVREVELSAGDNRIGLPPLEPGPPMRVELYPHVLDGRVVGDATWTLRDGSGAVVVEDTVRGAVDDPATGRVIRRLGLAAGSYRIDVVQRVEAGEVTAARAFDVVAGQGEQLVVIRVP